MYVDADAHVDECNDTWSYFPKKMEDLRPVEMSFDDGKGPGYLRGPRRGLFIDGQIFQHIIRDDARTKTTLDTRELYDVPARLKHMDEMGVDVQVLYPTTLLYEVTKRPEIEIGICESYNRWLGERCRDSGGRLQWTALVPFRSMPDALRELRRAKEDGAVGVFKRSVECDDRRAGDPYFDPAYELAQELDMPICIHVSRPYTGNHNAMTKTQAGIFSSAYTQDAFLSILMDGATQRYPRLRFGFVEAGSGWLPYTLWIASFQALFTNERVSDSYDRATYEAILQENRIFVTCESNEDLPDIIGHVGDTNLCVGSDYGHSDRSSVLMAHQIIMDRTDIERSSAERITDANGRAFYGF